LRSNIQATELDAPRLPPLRLKACRISATVRFALSVVASMKMAAPPGALVGQLLVGAALELAGALLDGALDVVVGHVDGFGRVDRRPQPGVTAGVAAAALGGHGDLADDFGPGGGAAGVGDGLLALDLLPLAVAGHGPGSL
jgi:hypothetical protein